MSISKVNLLRALSITLVVVSLCLAGYSFWVASLPQPLRSPALATAELARILELTRQLSVQAPDEATGDIEQQLKAAEIKRLQAETETLRRKLQPKLALKPVGGAETVSATTILWIKVAFSLLLGCAALYVVIVGRYPDETNRWAFSVLSLVSGVWIGTVT